MKNLLAQLKTEDWVIVLAGVAILALALLFPAGMPAMPKTLAGGDAWLEAGCMFAFLFVLTCLCMAVLGRPVKGIFGSLLAIFAVALAAQAVASVPLFKDLGLESVFFSVIFGLAVSNFFRVPAWLKPAIQSEFYIKIGIVCLGATILFGEILHSGVYALAQAFIVVFLVWYFAFWVSRRMKVDDEMATMLSSSVSICGVSAAIATCGVIKGDSKKLSYIISLVLVCAVPMMYVMPWLAKLVLPALLGDPKVVEEVAGAWMGGTIDTTGAVVASGALLGETAEQTAVIVKSSQNVLLGLAEGAQQYRYCRPVLDNSMTLRIVNGRHPVIEQNVSGDVFVPNDAFLEPEENRLILLTGPNMAGKSAYIRQVALITLMAQIGAYVPAEAAHIGLVDRIFCRVGASDDLARGQSTFMVEMSETSLILNNATERSLIILDEIGRGTATFDGLSIAWAVAEYLHDELKSRTLFATHYHELTDLANSRQGVQNYNVAVREWKEEIVFLRKIVPGAADKSYGIQVARLAGMPAVIVDRAKAILSHLEMNSTRPRKKGRSRLAEPRAKNTDMDDDMPAGEYAQLELF